MANVIRQDVVKLDFVIDGLQELRKLQDEINDLKKKLTGDLGDDAFEDIKNQAEETQKPVKNLTDNVGKLGDKLTSVGKKAATVAFNGLKKVASVSFKALAVSATAVATAIGKIAYESVQASAEYEQLKGGMEKIFDKANISQISKDANNAYKDLGISANQYLSIINDTGANFAATMGDQKGYDTARTGLTAISDYASGTGKNVDLLSEKFAMITRSTSSYQSIADQFSGVLPATSKDFLKQAQAAGILDKKYTELTKVPISEYQEAVSKMLKKGVADMGLAGNTLDEAEKTVSGSLGMMKASWQDLLVSFGTGENLDANFDKFIKSVETFGGLVIPVAEKALSGIATVVEKLAPIIAEKFPSLAEKLLPPLIKATISLTKGLIKALPTIVKTVVTSVGEILGEQFPALAKFGDFFEKNGKKIEKFIPVLLGLVGTFIAFNKIKSIGSIFSGIFGGGGSGGSSKGGLFGGITKNITELSKVKPATIAKGMANLAIIFGGFVGLTAVFMLVAPAMAKIGDTASILKMVVIIGAIGAVSMALAKFGEIAGKMKITTVLLGLANMAIMLAGMSALFLLVGAVSLIKFDLGRIMQITLIIGALGTIGAALSLFAGIVGLIPVPIVALGLANMAIVLAGMSALLLLMGATSLIDFNYNKILKVVGVIAVLGTVGATMTVFAGIVGMIPIPVVLAGLANMALVLGGVSALIVAFGKLSEIDGFTNFIEKGGKLLAKIFGVIGEMVGSLVGGVLEGITNSLPKVGENLSNFATALQPFFTAFSGVNAEGVGSFLNAIAGFMLKIAGSKALEFFTGKTDFSGVAEGLNTFAQSEGVKNFFNMVNGIEESAFNKGKLFFECLDGIGALPNTGGIGQWFSGKNDFEGVSTGLGQLAGQGVRNFFNMVNGIEETAFEKGEKFFSCLDGIGKLPNTDGLGQWFSGKNDFEGVSTGLRQLSTQGVKNFFAMVSDLDESTFTKTTKLFESLSAISKMPKEDNWWDKSLGSETMSLGDIAADLETFASKASNFFEKVNSLNVSNLNALWSSLKKSGDITSNVSKTVDKHIDGIVDKISDLPKKMGEALKNSSDSLSNSFVEVWKDAVEASVAPVNKLLDGANHILEEFGSKKKVISWTPYAKGTDGHKGGNALVNDGRGAELVQMPNGNTFIPKGRNVFLPNAPKGMRVLPAEQTARLMGKTSPTFKYAKGIGDIDVWSYYDNAKGLVNKIADGISYDGMSGIASHIGKGMVTTFAGEMPAWVDKLFEESGQSLANYVASKGVTQWLPTVVRALKMEGQYSALNVARTLFQMKTESGGNPKAINLWDSNAKKGIPSKGLMQVIDPTFRAYARKGFDKNIYDPLSNILASVRYAVARYGTLAKAYRGVGYENGGLVTKTGLIGENPYHPEWVIPTDPSKRKRALMLHQQAGQSLGLSAYTPERDGGNYTSKIEEHNTYSPQFHLTISGTNDDRAMARKVKKWISEAIDETFDSLERKSTRLQEV